MVLTINGEAKMAHVHTFTCSNCQKTVTEEISDLGYRYATEYPEHADLDCAACREYAGAYFDAHPEMDEAFYGAV